MSKIICVRWEKEIIEGKIRENTDRMNRNREGRQQKSGRFVSLSWKMFSMIIPSVYFNK